MIGILAMQQTRPWCAHTRILTVQILTPAPYEPHETARNPAIFIRGRNVLRVESPLAKKISAFKGVKSAFAVMGGADVVARIEVENVNALTRLGIQIGDLPDVATTETLVAAEE